MKKRIFTWMLVLVFLVSFLPVQALADSDDVAIAKQITYPTGDMYCSMDANVIRALPDGSGYMFLESLGKVKAAVIFMDFSDTPGAPEYDTAGTLTYALAPTGTTATYQRQNVFTRAGNSNGNYQGVTGTNYLFNYANPEHYFNNIVFGKDANGNKFGPGLTEYFYNASCGKMDLEYVSPNSLNKDGTGRWQWFHMNAPLIDYEIQFRAPNDAEDYRAFARLSQACMDLSYEWAVENDCLEEMSAMMKDVSLIYAAVPVNCWGGRQGLSGGYGIDTAFSYQDQWLIYEYYNVENEELGVANLPHANFKMYDGRLFKEIPLQKPHTTNPFDNNRGISSGVNTTKGARAYSPADFSTWQVFAHETNHCLGAIDDYTYEGGDYYASGWSNPCGNWGIMGQTSSMCSNATPDPTIWYKFRNGWLNDDQVVSVVPGESKTFKIAASGAKDAELAAAGITDAVKMVLLPTDLRTIDVLWPTLMTNNRAVHANGTIFDYLEYFMPLFLHAFAPDVEYATTSGGVTHPSRRLTFPTAYTLECRRAIGADAKNTSTTAGNKGVLINQLSNITWETGGGAAGQKTMRVPATASNPNTSCLGLAPYSNNSSWADNNRGITVKVIESAALYDVVEITYAKNTRPYIGELKINGGKTAKVTAKDSFALPLDLRTIGEDLTNGQPNPSVVAGRTGSPLGAQEGVVSLGATVTYDPLSLEYAGLDKAFEMAVVNDREAGKLVIGAANPEVLKGVIMGLKFKALTTAPYGFSLTDVNVDVNNVGLLDWRGNSVPISGIRLTKTGGQVDIWNAMMGDVDGNGVITPEDAMLILQHYVGLITLDPRQVATGLVSGNDELSPLDAALILRMVVGG